MCELTPILLYYSRHDSPRLDNCIFKKLKVDACIYIDVDEIKNKQKTQVLLMGIRHVPFTSTETLSVQKNKSGHMPRLS